MALVLSVQSKPSIWGDVNTLTTVTYNNEVYVISNTALYKYDPINNIRNELLLLLLTYTPYSPIVVGDYIYYVNGRYLARYNILSNTVTQQYKSYSQASSFNNVVSAISATVDDTVWFIIKYSYGSGPSYKVALIKITNSDVTVTDNYNTPGPINQQIFGNYYFNKFYSSTSISPVYRYGRVLKSGNYVATSEDGVTPDYLHTTEYIGSFEYDGDIYLSTKDGKIVKYDISGNTFTEMTLSQPIIPKSYWGVVERDGKYYILGEDAMYVLQFIDYNLTYSFKSNNGETTFGSSTGNSPITSVRFNNTAGDKTVGYIFETLTGTVSGEFEVEVPEGKILSGFSATVGGNKVQFPLNTTITQNIDVDFSFYTVFSSFRPPETTFNIVLYQNGAENNRVDKTDYLVGVSTLSGALREECSMLTPSIVYQSENVPTFNYVYIPIFNRYYFVTSLSSVSKNVWRMELNCDVLMTYKNEILLLQGVIGRQENDFNDFLIDDKIPTQKDAIVEVLDPISTTLVPFDTRKGFNDYIYVLTVIGG